MIFEDELLNTKRNSIIIDSINLDTYMNTLTLDTNTYYNHDIHCYQILFKKN